MIKKFLNYEEKCLGFQAFVTNEEIASFGLKIPKEWEDLVLEIDCHNPMETQAIMAGEIMGVIYYTENNEEKEYEINVFDSSQEKDFLYKVIPYIIQNFF